MPDAAHPLTIYRCRNGLSIEELADKAGCNRSTIYRIETGQRYAGRELALILSDITGIPLIELMRDRSGGDGEY
jgi:transcriptional regulator with XRE-family HTH domain